MRQAGGNLNSYKVSNLSLAVVAACREELRPAAKQTSQRPPTSLHLQAESFGQQEYLAYQERGQNLIQLRARNKMLHSRRLLQDENSAFQAPSKHVKDLENPKSALKQPAGSLAGLNSTRKALGNITNRAQQTDFQHPLKTPAGKLAPRRALGDITNATPKLQDLQSTHRQVSKIVDKQTTAKATQLQQRQKEDVWAEEGVERTAGKTRKELEQEAADREDAEIAARVAAFLSAPSAAFRKDNNEVTTELKRSTSATVFSTT